MSFWDNVKKFAQPYAEDYDDEYDEDELNELSKDHIIEGEDDGDFYVEEEAYEADYGFDDINE